MGTHNYTAFCVTGDTEPERIKYLESVRDTAMRFGLAVTPIYEGVVECKGTFFTIPSGSKDGWTTSTRELEGCRAFEQFLLTCEDVRVDWVRVVYGENPPPAGLPSVAASDHDRTDL